LSQPAVVPADPPPARPDALTPTLQRALAVIAIAFAGAWTGYYLITPLPFISVETFRATVALHLVTGIVIIPYLLTLVIGRRLPGGTPLDVPVLALLGVYLLATANSLDWRLSLEVSMTALMAIAVFYVLSDGGLFRRWQIETALMLAVLALALRALWVVGDDYLEWLRLTNAVRGSVGAGDLVPPTVPKVHDVGDHANLLGGIMAMALPFFIVALVRPWPRAVRAAAAIGALALLLAAFFSLARSAWLGAAIGTATTALLLAAFTPAGLALVRRVWGETQVRRALVAFAAVSAAVLVVALAFFAARSVESRPLWLFRESGEARVDAMGAGAEMVQDYPLLGTGPGVYGLLYPEYSGKDPNHAFHSHNGFLQAGVDMGLLGGAAMLLLAGTAAWMIVDGLRRTDGEARLSVIACASGLLAFGTFSLFDAPNGFKGPLVALAALGAVLALSYREGAARAETPGLLPPAGWQQYRAAAHGSLRAFVPVAAAGLLIVWGRLDIAHYYYSDSIGPQRTQQWPQAIDAADRAVELDPSFAPYRLQLGAIEGGAYLDTRDASLLPDAIAQLRRATELEPRSAIGHANLARLLAESNDRDGARAEAELALKYANRDLAVVLVAGSALEQANWGDQAVEAYSTALFLDAGLADSPFWQSTPFRQERLPDVISRSVIALSPCLMLELHLHDVPSVPLDRAEALEGCRVSASATGIAAEKTTLARALIEDSDLEGARAVLDDVLDREPDYGPARTALGSWYAAQRRIDDARAQWLRAGELGEVEALVLLGDTFAPGEVPSEVIGRLRGELNDAASQVQFHITGILYYRHKFFRGSPNITLLPGDWTQAVPARYADARDALDRWTSGGNP
jgi:O-antigen ligase